MMSRVEEFSETESFSSFTICAADHERFSDEAAASMIGRQMTVEMDGRETTGEIIHAVASPDGSKVVVEVRHGVMT